MSTSYLEQYLDSLDSLPIELQRNFTLMRELDSRAQDVMKTIDKMAEDYLNNIKHYSKEKKKETLAEIQKYFDKAKAYGDDKVQLAIQTYEMVDKYIRTLDMDLARFEAEIQEKAIKNTTSSTSNVAGANPSASSKSKRGRKKPNKDKVDTQADESDAKSKKKSVKKSSGSGSAGGSGSVVGVLNSIVTSGVVGGEQVAAPSHDVLDMPVDPNEPTYCVCQQVSYGEMIGCDNPDCPIEWFHFACVSLTTKPKGKWYCPKCSIDRKKK